MLIWTLIKIAARSLWANPLRTLFTMLGVIIGVGAVVTMLALGAGAQAQVLRRVAAMGSGLLVVRPGGDYRGGVGFAASTKTLKLTDATDILQGIRRVEAVAPLVMGRAQVKFFTKNINTTITGASQTYFAIRDFEVDKGESFSALEDEHVARLALLGASVSQQLFGSQNPLGEFIRIKNVNFRVIGVLKPKGDQGGASPDDMVLIPLTTAMKQVLGQDWLSEIDVKLAPDSDVAWAEDKINAILRASHRLRPELDADFHVRRQTEMGKVASTLTRSFSLLLGGIGVMSLIIGGIAITNIMLVSVAERGREIGMRKAIGARERDILRQFLLESTLISSLGGLLGVGLGLAVAWAVSRFTNYSMLVEGRGVALALLMSALVGLFFGYFPARRAAKLNPIEALRYE